MFIESQGNVWRVKFSNGNEKECGARVQRNGELVAEFIYWRNAQAECARVGIPAHVANAIADHAYYPFHAANDFLDGIG